MVKNHSRFVFLLATFLLLAWTASPLMAAASFGTAMNNHHNTTMSVNQSVGGNDAVHGTGQSGMHGHSESFSPGFSGQQNRFGQNWGEAPSFDFHSSNGIGSSNGFSQGFSPFSDSFGESRSLPQESNKTQSQGFSQGFGW